MEFHEWEPIYEAILAEFGYGRAGDEASRDQLGEWAEPFEFDRLACAGQTVAIAGAGPSLESEAARAADADRVFAASVAAERLAAAGVAVDAMVTDLDKTPGFAAERTQRGEPVVIHAHGDNREALTEWLPACEPAATLGTTQAAPAGPVENVGGFTDGDRAAFLADALDAAELRFVGWDFDDPTLRPAKAQKLRWAERLLAVLERRRGERFAVLDGRREAIEPIAAGE